MTTTNLSLWDSVFKTPPSETKAITGKPYKGTSPKPMYLVKKATETFGPCGIGWGVEIVNERVEAGAGSDKVHVAHVRVWYMHEGKRGVVEHVGQTMFSGTRNSGQTYTDEDAPKKSVTDAMVKALSLIGFAGDIFMGRYDDSNYVNDLRAEERNAPPAEDEGPTESEKLIAAAMKTAIDAAKTWPELNIWKSSPENVKLFNQLPDALRNDVTAYAAKRKEALKPEQKAA